MKLDNILTISGKPGLYKILAKTRTGAVVESLLDKKRFSVLANKNFNVLSEIAIFTLQDEKPLAEILRLIKEKYNGNPTDISHKAPKDDLEAFFFEILQDYDEDRVYPSDIKKIIQWYNLLQRNNLLDVLDEDNSTKNSDKEE